MSLAFRAFFIALFAVIKRWKIVFFFFIFNFLFSLFLALPLFKVLSSQVGHFSGIEGFINAFNPRLLAEFTGSNRATLDGFFLMAGMGGVLYFLFFQILSGGLISILADPRENTTMKTFLKATGKYCFRFVRLLFYYVIALIVLSFVNRGLDAAINWYFIGLQDYGSSSSTLGWVLFTKNVVMLLLLGFVVMSLNYGKTTVVVEDRHFMGGCFLSGMGFTLIHPLVTGIFFLLAFLLVLVVYYAYLVFSRWIDPGGSFHILESLGGVTLSGALLFFLFTQVVQFFIQGCLVFRHAGQVYIYKYLTVRTSNEDPELAGSDPYSPFIPDRPYTAPEEQEKTDNKEGRDHA